MVSFDGLLRLNGIAPAALAPLNRKGYICKGAQKLDLKLF
jgi:hypothetical protein